VDRGHQSNSNKLKESSESKTSHFPVEVAKQSFSTGLPYFYPKRHYLTAGT